MDSNNDLRLGHAFNCPTITLSHKDDYHTMTTTKPDYDTFREAEEDMKETLRLLRVYPHFQDLSHLRALNNKIDEMEEKYSEEVIGLLEEAYEKAIEEIE